MRVKKSTKQDYSNHIRILNRTYPIGIAKANNITLKEAKKLARKELQRLLPNGQKTENNFFYSMYQKDDKVGYLWLLKQDNQCLFIGNIYIFSRFRSKGIGSKAISWILQKARKSKFKIIKLHVFGHNQEAISLYQQNGFITSNVYMKKDIV